MIRVAAGVKQKDLSNDLKIPASLLSMYESGTREPSLGFLESFAGYFQLSLSHIFSLMENDSNEKKISPDLQEMKDILLALEKEVLKANQNAR